MKSISAPLLFVVLTIFFSNFSCGDFVSEDRQNYDSLFLGISLGMTREAFFDHCWQMNREKRVTHGPGNTSVEYHFIHESLRDTVIMRFYPTFHEGRINEMPVIFSYYAWAPWNKQFWADSLLVKMVPIFEEWYDGELKVTDHHTMGTLYYKMDGKRRINLFKRDDQFVQAVFTDLQVEKRLKEESASNE